MTDKQVLLAMISRVSLEYHEENDASTLQYVIVPNGYNELAVTFAFNPDGSLLDIESGFE